MVSRAVSLRGCLVLALSCLTLLVTGCAFSGGGVATTVGPAGSNGSAVRMTGKLHGGFQAIYSATVTLYAMNMTGYGAAPTSYASTTTGFDGSFTFTRGTDGDTSSGARYSCPSGASTAAPGSTADPEMYIVASGGDTSGSINANNVASAYNNTAAKMVLAVGDCNSLTAATQITLNEMSTVATMVSLQQFFNPSTEAFGAPSANVTGLVNAVNMIQNLMNTSNGSAQQTVTPTSAVAGVIVTGTPEYQKLNTIANILAACVSSTSSTSTNCSAITTNAVPPANAASTNFTSFPSATDTLLMADYMFLNPTDSQSYAAGSGRLYNLFNLPTTSTAPYSPALASNAQPMDWTIGINYVVTGACSNIKLGSSKLNPALVSAYGMAADSSGNIWMGGSGGSSSTGYDVLIEVSPQGGVMKCESSFGNAGGNTAGRRIAVDSQGNIWWATSQGLVEYITDTNNSSVGDTLLWPLPPTQMQTITVKGIATPTTFTYEPSGVAADQHGNIFMSPEGWLPDTSTLTANVYEYVNAATANATFAPTALGQTLLSDTGYPYRDIVVTASGNLFTEGTGGNGYVYLYLPGGTSNGGYTDSKVTLPSPLGNQYGLAEDSTQSIVGGSTITGTSSGAGSGRVYKFSGIDGSTPTESPNFLVGGINADRGVVIDGADNIWLTSATDAIDSTGTLNAVGEVDKNYTSIAPQGITISPASACTATAGDCETQGGFEKSFFTLNSMYALSIDSSGNFWGAEDATAGTPQQFFTIIGQAVPVKTPVVNNLH
jgi:hypothetical protein